MPRLDYDCMASIFQYLTKSERKNASLVCTHWYNAMKAYWTPWKCKLSLQGCTISPKCPPWNVLMKSGRQFSLLVIAFVKFESDAARLDFFRTLGEPLTTIEMFDRSFAHELMWEFLPNVKTVSGYFPDNFSIPATVEHFHLKRDKNPWHYKRDLNRLKAMSDLKPVKVPANWIDVFADEQIVKLFEFSPMLEAIKNSISEIGAQEIQIQVNSTLNVFGHTLEPCDVTAIRT